MQKRIADGSFPFGPATRSHYRTKDTNNPLLFPKIVQHPLFCPSHTLPIHPTSFPRSCSCITSEKKLVSRPRIKVYCPFNQHSSPSLDQHHPKATHFTLLCTIMLASDQVQKQLPLWVCLLDLLRDWTGALKHNMKTEWQIFKELQRSREILLVIFEI